MEPGKMDNTYHLFSAGGVDWIIFALEWGPRNSPVAWANQIITNYPNHRAILITHAYMYYDETRYDWFLSLVIDGSWFNDRTSNSPALLRSREATHVITDPNTLFNFSLSHKV